MPVPSQKKQVSSHQRNLIFPNETEWDPNYNQLLPSDWSGIQALNERNMQAMMTQSNLPQGNRNSRESFLDAINKAEGIKAFGNALPDQDSIAQRFPFNNIEDFDFFF